MAESGFLVLADLSGFTAFVTATELEHGPQITAELLDAVADRLLPLLRIENLEGDAIFASLADGELATPALLLDVVEEAFVAFRTRQRQIQIGTTCTCSACRSISSLSLKFVVHHGDYLRQTIGGRAQCTSTDVVIAHRLLKNNVQGVRAYLLVTEAALARTGVDASRAGMRPHREAYAHVGEVKAALADLEPVWQRAEQTAVRLHPHDALATLEAWLPVPPDVAWDWMVAPDKRGLWEELEMVESEARADGRLGVGTRYHCHHGRSETATFEIMDWKPFRYFTWDIPIPGVRVRGTLEFVAENGGTRVINLMGVPPGTGRLRRAYGRFAIKRWIEKPRAAAFARLRVLLEGDGRLLAGKEG